jgi:hypothetical protein
MFGQSFATMELHFWSALALYREWTAGYVLGVRFPAVAKERSP